MFAELWANFLVTYGNQILLLVVLVVVDVALGIASAIRRNEFHWSMVANFYRTTVVPKVIGWAAVSLLAYGIQTAATVIPDEFRFLIGPIVANGFYGALLLDLGASIISNYRELSNPAPAKPVSPPAA